MCKLKIVFHIPRMNWYRVLAPLIDETIRRGHIVECWHHNGAKFLKDNCPNREKVPDFKAGVPAIIDYEQPEDIISLISQLNPDVVIDLCPPRYPALLRDKNICPKKPFWILVDLPPVDSMMQINNDEELYACDAFALCNDFYLNATIKYGKQDKNELLSHVRLQAKELGTGAAKWVQSHFMYQFKNAQVQYIRERSIIVGNASFDEYSLINREDVRRRLGLPPQQKIIVLLPFPFGYDITAPWEQLYVRGSLLSRLLWVAKSSRLDCVKFALTTPSNKQLISALRCFADNNNCLLVAKIRHSREPAGELKRNCHMLFGDDRYYPHTAVELFSVADLVIGHYSFGSIEAVALNIPYLNIDIPRFPKKFYCDTRTTIHNCDPWAEVIWSMTAGEAIEKMQTKSLQEFKISQESRADYLRKFASFPLGGASARIIDHLEKKLIKTD